MKKSGKYWNWIVVARECLTIVILVVGKDLKLFQVMILLLFSILSQVLWFHLMPFKKISDNIWGILNEAAVSIYLYLMIIV